MKLVFMGTDEFAVPILTALAVSNHKIVGVFTRPPKMQNRGQNKLENSQVHKVALELDLEVFCPVTLKTNDVVSALKHLNPDAVIVASYGCIIPRSVLELPKYGCINVHPSLLPRWRGAAPIERAVLSGDKKTGVCIMQMDEGVDTGDVIICKEVTVDDQITAIELSKDLSELSAQMLLTVLDDIASIRCTKQTEDGMLYAKKLEKEEGRVRWEKGADEIHNMVRALNPWPGCFFSYNNEMIRILKSAYSSDAASGTPGEVIDIKDFAIRCGHGILNPLILQRPGKGAVSARDFVNGLRITSGTVLK